MDWLWLHLRFSLRLGWRDAIRKTSEHVVIGVIVVLTGAGLAWLTTGHFGDALLLLLAWPAAFVLFYLYYVAKRLAGRDPQWKHWHNTPAVDGGRQLNVRIEWWDLRGLAFSGPANLRLSYAVAFISRYSSMASCGVRYPIAE